MTGMCPRVNNYLGDDKGPLVRDICRELKKACVDNKLDVCWNVEN